MPESVVLVSPIAILAIVLVVRLAGCTFDSEGGGGPAPGLGEDSDYDGTVLEHEDLVAYWRLGEPDGATTATDQKGGHDGTFETVTLAENGPGQSAATGSPPVLELGAPGQLESDPEHTSVRVDGGYVEVPFDEALNPAAFSVEAWVVAEWDGNEALSNGLKPFRTVCSSREVVGGNTRGFTLYAGPKIGVEDDGQVYWQAWIGDGSDQWRKVFGPVVDLNQVTYLAVTYDGTTLKLYVNGSQDTDGSPSGQEDFDFVANTSSPLHIGMGAPESPTPEFPFKGRLQEVALYSADLDPTVIDNDRVVLGMTTGP